jgi:hypothetical protein
MKYAYFSVEGQHDVAAIGRILTEFHKANLVKKEEELDEFWRRLVPRKFPYEGYLLMRVPVPFFYQCNEYSIAIHSSNSDSKLIGNLKNTLLNLDDPDQLSAVAIFCDADDKSPQERCDRLTAQLGDIPALSSIEKPGQVINGTTRGGIYVFPDNGRKGTLETFLLECAQKSFPSLFQGACSYVTGVDETYKSRWRASDKQKVVVGCIANILRPGKANQVSIQDDDWICANTAGISVVKELNRFIKELLELL